MSQFPCPNPICTHVFSAQEVQSAGALKCPVCGQVFQFRAGAIPQAPSRPAVAKPAGAKPALAKPAVANPPLATPAPTVAPKPAPVGSRPVVGPAPVVA